MTKKSLILIILLLSVCVVSAASADVIINCHNYETENGYYVVHLEKQGATHDIIANTNPNTQFIASGNFLPASDQPLYMSVNFFITNPNMELDYFTVKYVKVAGGVKTTKILTYNSDSAVQPLDSINFSKVVFDFFLKEKPPAPTYTLTVTNGNGGSTQTTGSNPYLENTQVTITANPEPNYVFMGFDLGGTIVYDNPLTITMDSDKSITALFDVVPIDIEIPFKPIVYLHLDKSKGQDKITLQSKFPLELPPISDNQLVEINIIYKGLGSNGGNLVLKSSFFVIQDEDDSQVIKSE